MTKGLTCVDPHVVLVVGGACETPPTAGLGAHVWSLTGVGPDMHLADVGGGEGAPAALERTLKGLLTCNRGVEVSQPTFPFP